MGIKIIDLSNSNKNRQKEIIETNKEIIVDKLSLYTVQEFENNVQSVQEFLV